MHTVRRNGKLATLTDGCVPAGNCTGAVETYTYNNRLQPIVVQLNSQYANTCQVYNYYTVALNPTSCVALSYPPPSGAKNNGNVMGYYYSDPHLGHTATFGYDTVNRLHTAVATGTSPAYYNWNYTYDQYGNMSCNAGGPTGGVDTCASMYYNTSTNRLTAIGSQTPVYDPAGNLLSNGTGMGSQSYTWDAEGHMTTVSSPSGGSAIATYTYNALGQRVQSSGSGVGTYAHFHYYDAFGNLVEWGDNNTWNEILFPAVGGRLYGEYSNYCTFLHSNHLGSTGTATLADGTFEGDEIYDPWGQRWGTWNFQWGTERFAGMVRRDPESGLDHTPNRMFTSQYGRWLSPDPAGTKAVTLTDPQTWNMYAYARNNPTTLTDPSGLCDVDGEHHGTFWCAAHTFGFVETQKEQQVREVHQLEMDSQTAKQLGMSVSEFRTWRAESGAFLMLGAGAMAVGGELTAGEVPEGAGANFADDAKLQDHFQDHGADFGARTATQYEQQASAFLKGSKSASVLEKIRPNGDVVRYDPATQEFGVISKDGVIRTYFKPDPAVHGRATNLDYFNAE